MMARQVARQFCRLKEVHSLSYGRPSGKNGRNLTASTRVNSQSRLVNYLGLYLTSYYCMHAGDYVLEEIAYQGFLLFESI